MWGTQEGGKKKGKGKDTFPYSSHRTLILLLSGHGKKKRKKKSHNLEHLSGRLLRTSRESNSHHNRRCPLTYFWNQTGTNSHTGQAKSQKKKKEREGKGAERA